MDFAALTTLIQQALPGAVTAAQPEAFSPWLQVERERLPELALLLKDRPELAFNHLMCLSGVHAPAAMAAGGAVADATAAPAADGDKLWSVIHLFSQRHGHKLGLKIVLDVADPRCPSVAGIWPTADWHEREAYDMLGIVYEGHPDLRRILCPDDWEGHPLRKDYVTPATYNGMPLD